MDITDSASQTALIGAYEMSFKDARNAGGTLNSITPLDSSPAYNASTGVIILNAQSGPIEVTIGKIADRYGMTQLSDSFTPVTSEKDGAKSGTMKNVEIDQAGNVFAISDTGLARRLYQVPLVNLPNINGLSAQGDETYFIKHCQNSFAGKRGRLNHSKRGFLARNIPHRPSQTCVVC